MRLLLTMLLLAVTSAALAATGDTAATISVTVSLAESLRPAAVAPVVWMLLPMKRRDLRWL